MEGTRERECKRERKPRAPRVGDSIGREPSHVIDSGVKQWASMWNHTAYTASWPKGTIKLREHLQLLAGKILEIDHVNEKKERKIKIKREKAC